MQRIILNYQDQNSILMVNPKGYLRQLFCPFNVVSTASGTKFKPGVRLWVEAVESRKGELFYIILGYSFPHTYFVIIANF